MPDLASTAPLAQFTPKLDWADDDLYDLPASSTTIDPETGIKTVIEYRIEDGKKLKITRRIKTVTATERVSKSEARRKGWKKFGAERGKGAGPQSDTTSVGENIRLSLTPGYSTYAAKQREKEESSDANQLKAKLQGARVTCRICKGDHYTARCPYKETLKPLDGGEVDPAAKTMEEVDAGPQNTNGKYVPMHMRAGAKAGETMAGSRGGGRGDEFPTLRVTNISEDAEDEDLKTLFGKWGKVARVYLARDKDTKRVKGFAFIGFYDKEEAERAREKMDGFGFDNLILRVEYSKPREEK